MSYPLLPRLVESGHLLKTNNVHSQAREERALHALLSIRAPTFLQEYDALFRRVSLWLHGQGYGLTNYQPHQVLAQVCTLFVPLAQVREMVRCRHNIKYEALPATSVGTATLHRLLECFSCVTDASITQLG